MNISSLIVVPHPDSRGAVEESLRDFPGVEVHAVSPEGKFVVTIEAEDDAATAEIFERIGHLPGVLSASMVYQQSEAAPEEEIIVHSMT